MLLHSNLEHLLATKKIVLFVNETNDEQSLNMRAVHLFKKLGVPVTVVDLLKDADLRDQVYRKTGWTLTPQIFLNGVFLGGFFVIPELLRSKELFRWTNLSEPNELSNVVKKYLTKHKSPWKVAESKSHYWLASASGNVRSINKISMDLENEICVSDGWVNAISIAENGSIVFGTTDGCLARLSQNLQSAEKTEYIHDRWINDIAYNEIENRLYFVDGSGRAFRSNVGSPYSRFSEIESFGTTGWSIAVSDDGQFLAIGLGDGMLSILNCIDGSKTYAAQLHSSAITAITSTPDFFYFCAYDGYISKIRLSDFSLTQIKAHTERVWDIAVSSTAVATIGGDKKLRLTSHCLNSALAVHSLNKMPILVRPHEDGFAVFFADGTVEARDEWRVC